MIDFLNALDQAGIPYVSWKNNHELPLALEGKSDLDIFIPEECRAETLSLATSHGWKRLENPVAIYPSVTHLYKLGDDLQDYHLHVYFRLVTGESWLKEYQLPFDEFLVAQRVKYTDTGVWGLNPRAQAYLCAVRHLLKGESFFSRFLYRRELESYRAEWLRCGQDTGDLRDWGPVSLNDCLPDSGLAANDFDLPGSSTAAKFRARFEDYLRFSNRSLIPRRILSLVGRATNKLFLKRKKIIPGGGLIVAISGVDGAGKTTMLRESERIFSRFLTVRRLALGKPQGAVLEALRKMIRGKRPQSDPHNPDQAKHHRSARGSVLSSLSAALLALLRLKTAYRAKRFAKRGYLVLADRWPTGVHGMMDGPKLETDSQSPWIARTCAAVERWAYRRMPQADICFFLEAPESVLLERNREREKPGKETDAEIIARGQQNRQFEPRAQKTIRFDNDGPLEQKRKELSLQIWQEILAR